MKKIFTLMFAAMALVCVQSASAQSLKLGLKGGVTTKSYDFAPMSIGDADFSAGSSSNVGYQAGLALKISLPGLLYIQPELMYSALDYNYIISSSTYYAKTRIDVQRFELPVMLGINIKALRLYMGPKFILASSASSSTKEVDFSVDFMNSDFAAVAGFGFDVKNFFVDVSYTAVLGINTDKFTYEGETSKVNIKNDGQWNFNVGVFF